MKKYILKSVFSLLLVAFATISCDNEEFFELTNPPEFPWLNVSELERGAVAPYNIALLGSWNNFFGNDQLIFETMSDLVYLIPNTSADIPFNEMYFRTTEVEIGKANSAFSEGYKAIGATNAILGFLAENEDEPYPNPTQADVANIMRIKGEAYFMRAYTYFHLAKRHCPAPSNPEFNSEQILPLRTAFPTSLDEANKPEYVTTKEIYDLVVSDLIEAKKYLPETFDGSIHHPTYEFGRANRYAAAAILARVYFMLGDVDNALAELDYVISGPYSLNQDPIEAFNRSDASAGDEVIWYAMYYDQDLNRTQKIATSMNYSDYRAINGGRGLDHRRCTWHQFALSRSVLKSIGWMNDDLSMTEDALSDKRYQQLYWRLEGYRGNDNDDPTVYDLQYKFEEPLVYGDKYYRGPRGQWTNVPIIRLAEMYLTRSILRFNSGNTAGALADVNVVRERAGLAPLASVTAEDIHNERIKELAFEGDRFFYLQALGLPIPAGDRVDITPIEAPYTGLYWKLPQSELDFKNQ